MEWLTHCVCSSGGSKVYWRSFDVSTDLMPLEARSESSLKPVSLCYSSNKDQSATQKWGRGSDLWSEAADDSHSSREGTPFTNSVPAPPQLCGVWKMSWGWNQADVLHGGKGGITALAIRVMDVCGGGHPGTGLSSTPPLPLPAPLPSSLGALETWECVAAGGPPPQQVSPASPNKSSKEHLCSHE